MPARQASLIAHRVSMMNWQPDTRQLVLLKVALLLLGMLPFAYLLAGNSDADPVAFAQRWTGTWTINFLLLSLCVTPLRTITRLHWLMRLRRMLGLLAFFYATLHFLSYIGYDHNFDINEIARDVLKHPFTAIGFVAFLLMVPLAATSNQWAIARMGGQQWQTLHRNVYLIGILSCIHYLWLSKPEALPWPIAYTLALAALLGWRIRERRRKAIPVTTMQASTKPLRFFRQRPE
jgi:methionine sulfoxide reductase heme-binding subunit